VEIFGMTSTLLLTPFVITVVAKSSGKIFKNLTQNQCQWWQSEFSFAVSSHSIHMAGKRKKKYK
jgi:hypothetical protein